MTNANDKGILINVSPRPRMLVYGLDGNPTLVERIRTLVPTLKTIQGWTEVRQSEWDIVVTDKQLWDPTGLGNQSKHIAPHLSVVFLSSSEMNYQKIEQRNSWHGSIGVMPNHVSRELKRIKQIPERIASLVHEQLEPVLKSRDRDRHEYFYRSTDPSFTSKHLPQLEPFITTGDDLPLACRYKRSEASEAWLLPQDTPDLFPWVRTALAEWHALCPDRFPGVPDWSRNDEWMTAAEQQVIAAISDLNEERHAILQRLDEREALLRQQLIEVRETVDSYERALLTTQSDELVAATIMALRELGFSVLDADKEAPADDHLEDLLIKDPDAPDWVALGEVKGYTKGAKTEAIIQFTRFTARYAQRTGRLPDALWYVVNQFLAKDPSTRQRALNGKDEDVAAFAVGGGLVIDTVALFRLLKRVRDADITLQDARELLRTSTGRLEL